MDNRPVGVYDSGLGGMTVWREIRRQLPEESLVYLGDGKNCPYGARPADEICRLADEAVGRLVGAGCKMVVVACNTATAAAIDFLRRKKRQQHVSLTFSDDEDEGKELSVPDPEPLPEERVIFNEKQAAIRAAMNALPVDFREILQLRVVQELPYEQIAQIMDLPVGTVKSRLARARLQLKKRLDAGNFFETDASNRAK